jgi:hypothetical protein
MRAVLLAIATVTMQAGRSGPPDHRGGADHQQLPEIAVALLGDAPEPVLAAGRVLARDQTQEGGELAAGAEQGQVGYRGG